MSRTPTQVASHAQKYFIRQSNATRRKRRSSLFDMVADDMVSLASKIISCFIILFLHDAYAGRQVVLPVAKMHLPFRFALLPVSLCIITVQNVNTEEHPLDHDRNNVLELCLYQYPEINALSSWSL